MLYRDPLEKAGVPDIAATRPYEWMKDYPQASSPELEGQIIDRFGKYFAS